MHPPAELSPFRQDLRKGFLVAVGLSVIAAIPLALMGVMTAYGVLVGHAPLGTLRDWLLVVVAVFGAYFLAAAVGAPIFAALRPIRGRVWGAMITGALLAPVIYGSVYVMALVLWEPAGRIMFGDHGTTRAEFLADGRVLLPFAAVAGLIAGPFMQAKAKQRRGAA